MKKKIYTDTILEVNKPTFSGKIYSAEALKEAMALKGFKGRIETKTLFGENGHPRIRPYIDNVARFHSIETDNVVIVIHKVYLYRGLLKMKYEFTNSSDARELEEIRKHNPSSLIYGIRGVGESINNFNEVSSLKIIAIDVILNF